MGVAIPMTLVLLSPRLGLSSKPLPVTYRNTAGVDYVGSKVCGGCHSSIYERYMQTGMARSMSPASEAKQLAVVANPQTIFDDKLNRYFGVGRDGPDLYQCEYELDSADREVFRNTFKIQFVIGSGANGRSYIIRRNNWLFQAPLSFYSKPKKWGLSPGYEFEDYGFRRPIKPSCLVCHSGRPQPVAGSEGLYRDPPFLELAVGCENCHGPGELHVEERAKGLKIPCCGDTSIVNPARLPGWLADNVCMNCHQTGDARVLQPGKNLLDFRPGLPLDTTLAIFKVPLGNRSQPESGLLEHYSSMILSRCYRESGNSLTCLSCHDPHYQPTRQDAPAYFRSKCLACHTNQSCTLPLETRLSKRPPNNCAQCHLPKRDIKFIAHSALTNHRIVLREGEPLPNLDFPDRGRSAELVHLDAIPGSQNTETPSLTLMLAYGQILASHPEYQARYFSLLNNLANTHRDNPLVMSALAYKALSEENRESTNAAAEYLRRAIELGSTSTSDYLELAQLLARSGRATEATEVLKRGVTIAPYAPALYQLLVQLYISLKQFPEALDTMREELRLFPEDTQMKNLLNGIELRSPPPVAP